VCVAIVATAALLTVWLLERRVTDQERADKLCASFGLRDMRVVGGVPATRAEWISHDRFAARCAVVDLDGRPVGEVITDDSGGTKWVTPSAQTRDDRRTVVT
jgi:hypothetical protein